MKTKCEQIQELQKENKRLHKYIAEYVKLAKEYNTPVVWVDKEKGNGCRYKT